MLDLTVQCTITNESVFFSVLCITMDYFALYFFKEAPSNNIGGGWSGEVRAIKWSDQEEQHGGCKGLLCMLSTDITNTRAPSFIASRGLFLHCNIKNEAG